MKQPMTKGAGSLPADVARALAAADRGPGWNNRDGCIRRFELDGCALYIVPFRRWAWRAPETRPVRARAR